MALDIGTSANEAQTLSWPARTSRQLPPAALKEALTPVIVSNNPHLREAYVPVPSKSNLSTVERAESHGVQNDKSPMHGPAWDIDGVARRVGDDVHAGSVPRTIKY